jgi:S-layer protein (TIGR01567 family)
MSNLTDIGTNTTIPLQNLDQGTTYYFSIFAYNGTNQSYFSNSTIGNFTTTYPAPTITNPKPLDSSTADIIVGSIQNFNVTVGGQDGIISWYRDDFLLKNQTVTSGQVVSLIYNQTDIGQFNITANISNINGSNKIVWLLNVHPTTYYSGNRIWDGSKPNNFSLTYSWTPQSFSGFYYNAKNDVGTENITITMDTYQSKTIGTGHLVYSTSPQEVNFTHSLWGSYQVIGFMADKYFAGYSANTSSDNTRPTTDFSGISSLSQGGLHRVLIDDDTKQTISVGGTLALQDGYVLKATDIDLNARTMLLSLLKDGTEVDVSPLSAGETYVYTKTVGGVQSLPLIMVRFDSVFSGQELQVAFIKGLFQISEDLTSVHTGDQFSSMKVSSVSLNGIQMTNSANIGLSKGTTNTVMGDVKIQVANNDSVVRFALTVDRPSNLEVRSTVYRDSDTPPVKEWTPYNFGMNLGDTSVGFYYDLDAGVGGEDLKIVNPPVSGRSIPDGGLVYTTTPQEVGFTYTGFGKYQAIGFMADRYFAGYTSNTGVSSTRVPIITRPSTDFGGISTIANGNLHKVLIDDDTKTTIAVGSTITLKEGYVLKATDIDLKGRAMLLSLLKDGTEVDVSPLSAGETYVYTKTVGGTESLPLIMVRFESVFSGQELQVAFLRGIFQISENPTSIKVGNQFGSMEVTSVSKDSIQMSNSGSIGLSRNSDNALMGNISLKVADTDAALRFYFAVDVTPEMVANQLLIDAPAKVMAGDTLKVNVTAGGKAVDNSSLTIDTDIGTTDINGQLNYTIPRTLKAGTYNITATKTGYEKATKNIEIEKYVDYRLSIEMPANANQYENITIKVLFNGTAMSGAAVMFDNTSIGTTDSNGELMYRLETSGTHSVTASKTSYITVSRDIDIRAPYSEFKALDINVSPNPVFTGDNFVIKSNITNVGTKSDTLPVNLIINGTAVDNRTITIGPNEKVEINFTRQEPLVTNVTVDIMGQNVLLEVQKKPTNYLWIAAIATGIGAVIIYVLTSKGLLSLEILKQKFEVLSDKINNLFKR